MTDKELKKLSRRELLEILIAQEKENKHLREDLEKAEIKINNNRIKINKAGSIAKASLELNGIFEAADAAVSQYIENIQFFSQQQETIYNDIVAKANAEADEILKNAESEARETVKNAEKEADKIIKAAEAEKAEKVAQADAYLKKVENRLKSFYESNKEMKKLLDSLSGSN